MSDQNSATRVLSPADVIQKFIAATRGHGEEITLSIDEGEVEKWLMRFDALYNHDAEYATGVLHQMLEGPDVFTLEDRLREMMPTESKELWAAWREYDDDVWYGEFEGKRFMLFAAMQGCPVFVPATHNEELANKILLCPEATPEIIEAFEQLVATRKKLWSQYNKTIARIGTYARQGLKEAFNL